MTNAGSIPRDIPESLEVCAVMCVAHDGQYTISVGPKLLMRDFARLVYARNDDAIREASHGLLCADDICNVRTARFIVMDTELAFPDDPRPARA